jgi:AcrR family transcriptional regulator
MIKFHHRSEHSFRYLFNGFIKEIMMKEDLQYKKAAALKATLELISELGFQGTSISKIAEKANIGVGTIYRYFANKEDLINALYIDIKTNSSRVILGNYSKELSTSESLKHVINSTVHYFIKNPIELSLMEQYENSPLITATTHEEVTHLIEPLMDLFRCAVAENLLKELPFEILVTLFSGAVISLAKLYITGKVKIDEKMLNISINAIWDMLKG